MAEKATVVEKAPPARTRASVICLRYPPPGMKALNEGGELWLEAHPFPHARIGYTRVGMENVSYFRLPTDSAALAKL
jgi:hypothetical protein